MRGSTERQDRKPVLWCRWRNQPAWRGGGGWTRGIVVRAGTWAGVARGRETPSLAHGRALGEGRSRPTADGRLPAAHDGAPMIRPMLGAVLAPWPRRDRGWRNEWTLADGYVDQVARVDAWLRQRTGAWIWHDGPPWHGCAGTGAETSYRDGTRADGRAGSGTVTRTMEIPHLWLWSAGPECGLSDDEERAVEHAEKAALSGDCPVLLELAVVGIGTDLEPVYVHTDISYIGMACGGRVSWMPGFSGTS